MCIFRSKSSTPAPVAPAPQPIQPRNPDLVQASRLPAKKELLDPDEVAGVEYGTTAKKDPKGTAQRTGTDAQNQSRNRRWRNRLRVRRIKCIRQGLNTLCYHQVELSF